MPRRGRVRLFATHRSLNPVFLPSLIGQTAGKPSQDWPVIMVVVWCVWLYRECLGAVCDSVLLNGTNYCFVARLVHLVFFLRCSCM